MFMADDSAALLAEDTATRLATLGTDPEGCGGTQFLRAFVAEQGETATIAEAIDAFEALPGNAKIGWALSMLAIQGDRLYPELRMRLAQIIATAPAKAGVAVRILDGIVSTEVKALLRDAAEEAGVVIAEGALPGRGDPRGEPA